MAYDLNSENARGRCISGVYFQSAAVKKQPLNPGRLEEEKEIIRMLEKKDKHKRLLRCVDDGESSYMAMEPCLCNLIDLIKFFINKRTEDVTAVDARLKGVLPNFELYDRSRPRPQTLKILRELIDEMTIRHSLGLGHSEFNPEQIFLAMEAKPVGDGLDMAPLCLKFYDYDICVKKCKYAKEDNQNDFTKRDISHLSNDWTEWWKSPEQLTLVEKASLSSDMFLLGLVFYYVLSEGNHPFDSHPDRIPKNIVVDEPRLSLLVECPESCHLINILLQKEPHLRWTIKEISLHPLFWRGSKKMQFLFSVNDRIRKAENETQQSTQSQCLLVDLDVDATKTKMFSKLNGNNQNTWHTDIQILLPDFDLDENYRNLYGSVRGLLRFIRDRVSHYWEDPILNQLGEERLLDRLYEFFGELFPSLLIELYKIILKHCSTEEFFMEFFKINEDG